MKLWKAHHHDPDMGCLVAWFASKREATAHLQRTLAEYDDPDNGQPSGINLVDVPTTKASLIDWLNRNLSSDNG